MIGIARQPVKGCGPQVKYRVFEFWRVGLSALPNSGPRNRPLERIGGDPSSMVKGRVARDPDAIEAVGENLNDE
jgi:hypothetical protein